MSDSNIGWIDKEKMKAALQALRSNQRKAKPPRDSARSAEDFVDLFGVPQSAPIPRPTGAQAHYVQSVDSGLHSIDPAMRPIAESLPQTLRATTPTPLESQRVVTKSDAVHPEDVRAIARQASEGHFPSTDRELEDVRDAFRGLGEAADTELPGARPVAGTSSDLAFQHAPPTNEHLSKSDAHAIDSEAVDEPSHELEASSSEYESAFKIANVDSDHFAPAETPHWDETAPNDSASLHHEAAFFEQPTIPLASPSFQHAETAEPAASHPMDSPFDSTAASEPSQGRKDLLGASADRASANETSLLSAAQERANLEVLEAKATAAFLAHGEVREEISDSHNVSTTVSTEGTEEHPLSAALSILKAEHSAPLSAREPEQELDYESAIPELTRYTRGAESSAADASQESDEEPLSLPTAELNLTLRDSLTSLASLRPIRDTINVSEAMVFDEEDFEFGESAVADEFAEIDEQVQAIPSAGLPITKVAQEKSVYLERVDAPSRASSAQPFGFDAAAGSAGGTSHGIHPRLSAELNQRLTQEVPAVLGPDSDQTEPASLDREEKGLRSVASPSFQAVKESADISGDTISANNGDTSSTGADNLVAASAPKIVPQLLGTLRWRQLPAFDGFSSLLEWLQGVADWVVTIEPDTEVFVADESGLGLIRTAVSDDVIAISVAMRQSMAILHRLHDESAPGFTVFRHDSNRYMNMLWIPSPHGVVTLGILSRETYPDDRLEALLQHFNKALAGLPFI